MSSSNSDNHFWDYLSSCPRLIVSPTEIVTGLFCDRRGIQILCCAVIAEIGCAEIFSHIVVVRKVIRYCYWRRLRNMVIIWKYVWILSIKSCVFINEYSWLVFSGQSWGHLRCEGTRWRKRTFSSLERSTQNLRLIELIQNLNPRISALLVFFLNRLIWSWIRHRNQRLKLMIVLCFGKHTKANIKANCLIFLCTLLFYYGWRLVFDCLFSVFKALSSKSLIVFSFT